MLARCKKICNEIILANGSNILEMWSHLKKSIVVAFVSYLYSGMINVEFVTSEDLDSAKYFSENYPDLEGWRLYVESYIEQIT